MKDREEYIEFFDEFSNWRSSDKVCYTPENSTTIIEHTFSNYIEDNGITFDKLSIQDTTVPDYLLSLPRDIVTSSNFNVSKKLKLLIEEIFGKDQIYSITNNSDKKTITLQLQNHVLGNHDDSVDMLKIGWGKLIHRLLSRENVDTIIINDNTESSSSDDDDDEIEETNIDATTRKTLRGGTFKRRKTPKIKPENIFNKKKLREFQQKNYPRQTEIQNEDFKIFKKPTPKKQPVPQKQPTLQNHPQGIKPSRYNENLAQETRELWNLFKGRIKSKSEDIFQLFEKELITYEKTLDLFNESNDLLFDAYRELGFTNEELELMNRFNDQLEGIFKVHMGTFDNVYFWTNTISGSIFYESLNVHLENKMDNVEAILVKHFGPNFFASSMEFKEINLVLPLTIMKVTEIGEFLNNNDFKEYIETEVENTVERNDWLELLNEIENTEQYYLQTKKTITDTLNYSLEFFYEKNLIDKQTEIYYKKFINLYFMYLEGYIYSDKKDKMIQFIKKNDIKISGYFESFTETSNYYLGTIAGYFIGPTVLESIWKKTEAPIHIDIPNANVSMNRTFKIIKSSEEFISTYVQLFKDKFVTLYSTVDNKDVQIPMIDNFGQLRWEFAPIFLSQQGKLKEQKYNEIISEVNQTVNDIQNNSIISDTQQGNINEIVTDNDQWVMKMVEKEVKRNPVAMNMIANAQSELISVESDKNLIADASRDCKKVLSTVSSDIALNKMSIETNEEQKTFYSRITDLHLTSTETVDELTSHTTMVFDENFRSVNDYFKGTEYGQMKGYNETIDSMKSYLQNSNFARSKNIYIDNTLLPRQTAINIAVGRLFMLREEGGNTAELANDLLDDLDNHARAIKNSVQNTNLNAYKDYFTMNALLQPKLTRLFQLEEEVLKDNYAIHLLSNSVSQNFTLENKTMTEASKMYDDLSDTLKFEGNNLLQDSINYRNCNYLKGAKWTLWESFKETFSSYSNYTSNFFYDLFGFDALKDLIQTIEVTKLHIDSMLNLSGKLGIFNNNKWIAFIENLNLMSSTIIKLTLNTFFLNFVRSSTTKFGLFLSQVFKLKAEKIQAELKLVKDDKEKDLDFFFGRAGLSSVWYFWKSAEKITLWTSIAGSYGRIAASVINCTTLAYYAIAYPMPLLVLLMSSLSDPALGTFIYTSGSYISSIPGIGWLAGLAGSSSVGYVIQSEVIKKEALKYVIKNTLVELRKKINRDTLVLPWYYIKWVYKLWLEHGITKSYTQKNIDMKIADGYYTHLVNSQGKDFYERYIEFVLSRYKEGTKLERVLNITSDGFAFFNLFFLFYNNINFEEMAFSAINDIPNRALNHASEISQSSLSSFEGTNITLTEINILKSAEIDSVKGLFRTLGQNFYKSFSSLIEQKTLDLSFSTAMFVPSASDIPGFSYKINESAAKILNDIFINIDAIPLSEKIGIANKIGNRLNPDVINTESILETAKLMGIATDTVKGYISLQLEN